MKVLKLRCVVLLCVLLTWSAWAQEDSLKRTQHLDDVVIRFTMEPEAFYARRNTFILDLHQLGNGLLLLTKFKGDYYVELIAWNGRSQWKHKLGFKSREIEVDCASNLYFVADNNVHWVEATQVGIKLKSSFMKSYFEEFIEPCVADSEEHRIMKHWGMYNQAVELWSISTSGRRNQVYRYMDSVGMADRNAEMEQIKRENYSNHARMGDIWVPELEELKDKQERKMFFENVLVQKTYCPFFKDSAGYCFFNFMCDSILFFDKALQNVGQIGWTLPRLSRMEGVILYDQNRANYYFLDRPREEILQFDPRHSEVKKRVKSKAALSDRKIIHNGKVYYLGKDSMNDPFNKVFVQRLL